MPDSVVLNVRQITQYPPVNPAGLAATDVSLWQSGGLGGPYVTATAQQIIAGGLAAPGGGPLTITNDLHALGTLTVDGDTALGAGLTVAGTTDLAGRLTFRSPIVDGFLTGMPASNLESGVYGFRFFVPSSGTFDWNTYNDTSFTNHYYDTDIAASSGLQSGLLHLWVFPSGPAGSVLPGTFVDYSFSPTGLFTAPSITTGPLTVTGDIDFAGNLVSAVGWPSLPASGLALGEVYARGFSVPTGGSGYLWNAYTDNTSTARYYGNDIAATANIMGGNFDLLVYPVGAPNAALASPAAYAFSTGGILSVPTTVVLGRVPQSAMEAANMSWVQSQISASFNNTNLTGIPTAPTANPGTSTGQIATTAFVMNAVAASVTGVVSWNGRNGVVNMTAADINNVGGALLNSPNFTGSPTAPTPPAADDSIRIATTAWVLDEIASVSAGVVSWNGQSGVVIMQSTDITNAGGALLAGPAFTGVPTAPTAAPNTSTGQIATTAFVMNAILAGTVSSFNGRTGVINLLPADISAAGGAPINNPTFTGSPSAPTPAPGDSSTLIATTAFVKNAFTGIVGVSSFNTRQGAVTLTSADISAAGGALANAYLPLTGGTLTGNLTVNMATPVVKILSTSGTAWLYLSNSASTYQCNITGQMAGSNRWTISLGGGAQETGSNVGSDFGIARYGDNGAYIDTPLSIIRSSGLATFTGDVWDKQASPRFVANKNASGGYNQFIGMTNGVLRWNIIAGDAAAESGSNAGSNFAIYAYTDGGGNSTALTIYRSNLSAVFGGQIYTAGGMIATGNNWGIQAQGSSNAMLSSWDTNQNAGAGIFLGSGPRLYFGNANNSGQYGSTQFGNFDFSGNFTIQGGAVKPGGGPWSAPSDARIKTVHGLYQAGLDQLLQLRPVWFSYKANDEDPDFPTGQKARTEQSYVGFVAQELERIFPTMVKRANGWIDGKRVSDLRSTDASELTYALINAVKELAARVAALEAA